MVDSESPRTRLEQVLGQRRMTVDDFRVGYERESGDLLSGRQVYRWVAGDLKGMPHPRSQVVLERMFGEPAVRLLGLPYGIAAAMSTRSRIGVARRGCAREDWQGQVVARSAGLVRDFLRDAEATNVGTETLDQLADDVRRLAVAYPRQPLASLLEDIADAQERALGFLGGRQRLEHTRDLYLLAGVASGLMAMAGHDLGAPHDALTHARAAYTCADSAGHDGLRAWTRGMQSLISYRSGRLDDAVRYAEQGTDAAARSQGTAAVWLAVSQARPLAALGRIPEAYAAIERATEARDHVYPDELDDLGGLCTFTRPRQLYYAADALAWAGHDEADHTERLALQALDAYEHAPESERAFGGEAGTRCALAIARIVRREIEGAAEAMAPVLELPPAQRIYGVVTSVEHVHRALVDLGSEARAAADLASALHSFGADRLVLPR